MKIDTMTPEQKVITIAKACGVEPVLDEWWVTSPDEKSIVLNMPHKHDCERWLAELPEGSPYKDWHVKPFYRYPDYLNSLDACAEFEAHLSIDQKFAYCSNLSRLSLETVDRFALAFATSSQRADAFLMVLPEGEG